MSECAPATNREVIAELSGCISNGWPYCKPFFAGGLTGCTGLIWGGAILGVSISHQSKSYRASFRRFEMRNFKAPMSLGRHAMCAACLLFTLAATTNAYSIVMRGGKRIEIPAQFIVNNLTLTYEAAPGFWITLQMAAVDIPATERANNEISGSLLARATKEKKPPRMTESTSQAPEPMSSRSITNRELKSFERSRLESERAYEQRLKDQGLPPLAVLRAQAAADAERIWQELARTRAEAEANERASQLQAQITALSTQLNYLQSRSGELSTVSTDAFAFYGGVPFFGGRSRVNPALFRVPFGLPVGGAFGTFNVPFGTSSRFHGLRRNIIVAPGTRIGGRGGSRGGPHGRPRSR